MNSKLLISLCFSILFFSCKKNQREIITERDAITSLRTWDEQMAAFQSLTPTEACQLWVDKLDHLATQTRRFNEEQIGLIIEMRNSLRPEYYETESEAKDVFAVTFVKDWIERAKTKFLPEDYFDVCYTIDDFDPSEFTPQADTARMDCHCNVGSAYTCPTALTHAGFPSGVYFETRYGDCNKTESSCKSSWFGCGWGGLFNCNGNHCSH